MICFCLKHKKKISLDEYQECSGCGSQLKCETFLFVGNAETEKRMWQLIDKNRVEKLTRILNDSQEIL